MSTHVAAPLAHPVNDACKRLGISRVTLYALLGRGELRGIKVGSKRLIPESELQRFIADKLAAPSVAA